MHRAPDRLRRMDAHTQSYTLTFFLEFFVLRVAFFFFFLFQMWAVVEPEKRWRRCLAVGWNKVNREN